MDFLWKWWHLSHGIYDIPEWFEFAYEGNVADFVIPESDADGAIPKDLGSLISLQVLDLSRNDFHTLPSLSGLSKLETLRLHKCFNLRTIPDIPPNQVILPNSLEAPRLDKLLNPMTWTDMKRFTKLTADFGKNII
ncbi:hypothetical protein DVH24_017879 [Malus domestica]|uniref:Uncharacterized protein n=1 Tax=Malus domestica TaxID=3750 RepID=A0A498KEN4_MALDO|nr:hypothetical protein DVH24_017879 [Malus domestica]